MAIGRKRDDLDDDSEEEIELVLFQGPVNGREVNLDEHRKLADALYGKEKSQRNPAPDLVPGAATDGGDATGGVSAPPAAQNLPWSFKLKMNGIEKLC